MANQVRDMLVGIWGADALTVGNTVAVRVMRGSAPLPGRNVVTVYNNSTSAILYANSEASTCTTAKGLPIPPGTERSFSMQRLSQLGVAMEVYVISDSAAGVTDCRIAEGY